eukprot:1286263-Prymnesium_polylepis.1
MNTRSISTAGRALSQAAEDGEPTRPPGPAPASRTAAASRAGRRAAVLPTRAPGPRLETACVCAATRAAPPALPARPPLHPEPTLA